MLTNFPDYWEPMFVTVFTSFLFIFLISLFVIFLFLYLGKKYFNWITESSSVLKYVYFKLHIYNFFKLL